MPPPQAKTEPAPLTNGVIQTQQIAAIPGSSEPMKPVKVKTVQVKAGQIKLASAESGPAGHRPSPMRSRRHASEVPETSSAGAWPKAETNKAEMQGRMAESEIAKSEIAKAAPEARNAAAAGQPRHRKRNPRRTAGFEPASRPPPRSLTGNGLRRSGPRAQPQPQAVQQNGAIKPVAVHTGWIVQVGALESESEAQQRIEAARSQARGLLTKADPFTEPVVAKGDKKLFRARFAGLDRDQAEAVCRTLKRSDISCITVRN